MSRISQDSLRRFAPAVLVASLLFLGIADASASCLAAWLCPPPATDDCAHSQTDGSSWENGSRICGFEARVDRASKRVDTFQLLVFAIAASFMATTDAGRPLIPFTSLAGLPSPGPPLYKLKAALLI